MPVNRAFVTGRIQSEILYRVSGFHLFSARFHFTPFPRVRLLSALQSPNLRFSRDFSASSKMKGSLSNLFQRSSCSLSMETGRLFSGTLVSWNAFFLVSLFFILLLFFFSNTFCPRLVRENGAEMEISSVVLRRDFNF